LTGFSLTLFLSCAAECGQPNQLSITHETVPGTGDNWGFETATLQGWKADGDAFQFHFRPKPLRLLGKYAQASDLSRS
jgi:hypothetical protein